MKAIKATSVLEVVDLNVEDKRLGFQVRLINGCKKLGIKTVSELITKMDENRNDFLKTFGRESRKDILRVLKKNEIVIEPNYELKETQKIILKTPILSN